MMIATVSFAQIGYQVSLLDNATGEPRANETVSCNVELTNSEGGTIYSGTQTVTSNEFGVLSLTIGSSSMFKDMDWTKLPLYVSVTVDGKLIGRSQVLSVPVAEYAKKTGVLTYENVHSKRIVSPRNIKLVLSGNTIQAYENDKSEGSGTFRIEGNCIFGKVSSGKQFTFIGYYSSEDDSIYITLSETTI